DTVTGRGTGVDDDGWRRKVDAVRRALAVNEPDARDGVDVLAKVGGFEIGGLVGVILGGAARRVPVALDGFIAGAAALVVAGVASGVGKTSITLGLLRALRRRGLSVQPFKVGPDFIDPGLHAVASGRSSYNLDGWMCGRDAVLATVARHAADVDIAIIE